ncbi:MAG: FkbM family methyltransferase [Flavobacteriaceae bacterium]|nr:FkbM family methyltransferase [Flavobacteriaceae bacterium]
MLDTIACDITLIDGDPSAEFGDFSERHSVRKRADVLGRGGIQTWFETNQPSMSSTLEPNPELENFFTGYSNRLTPFTRTDVETSKLDEVFSGEEFDFVKSDCQGSDLEILKNGEKLLRSVKVIEIEVEFMEQYLGQPLFSEVEQYLRNRGFQFHKFSSYGSRPIKSLHQRKGEHSNHSQWLWAIAIFFRNISSWTKMSKHDLAVLSLILGNCYASLDAANYAASLIE